MRRLVFALMLAAPLAVVMTANEAVPVRLLEVSATQDGGAYAVLIEASEPASYSTHQPDAQTVVVELRNVDVAGVVSRVPEGGLVSEVEIEDGVGLDGGVTARVRLHLLTPASYEVQSRRGTIRLDFDVSVGAVGEASLLAPAAGAVPEPAAATELSVVETLLNRHGLVVRLAGDGALRPSSIHEAEQWPPRLVIDLPEIRASVSPTHTVEIGPLRRIRVAAHSETPLVTRVVLDLEEPTTYRIEGGDAGSTDLRVIIPLDGGVPLDEAAPSPFITEGATPAPASVASATNRPDPLAPTTGSDLVLDPMAALRTVRPSAEPTAEPAVGALLAEQAAGPSVEDTERADLKALVLSDDITLVGQVAALRVPLGLSPPPLAALPLDRETAPVALLPSAESVAPAVALRRGEIVSGVSAPAVPASQTLVLPPRAAAPQNMEALTPPAPQTAPAHGSAPASAVPPHFPAAARMSRFIRRTSAPPAASAQIVGLSQTSRRYTGSPVSMDFQNVDLRAVLRTFAEISGLNIVIDPQVEGSVDVALREVPWDQALDIILRANQLGYSVDGTVVRIAPLTTLSDEESQRRKLAEELALSGELVVLTRTLSYARAADMGNMVTASVLSPRGQVQVDERTNTMIITDLQDRLVAAEELLDTLDRAEPQVEIEARIVQAGQNFARSLGVQWGVTGRAAPDIGNTTPLTFPNRGGVSGRVGNADGPVQGPEANGVDARALETENAGTAVNLPATNANSALGITLGAVDGSLNLDVVISAAENEGVLKVLSNPRVTTQNNIQAEIIQGDKIPIQTVANNTVTVTFKDAALRLAVTPQITAADTVIMQIEIDNDFADFSREVNGVPPIVTQRAATTVQVGNGETTVIGGIFESQEQTSNSSVPGLSKIPLLGWLFKNELTREETDELLIFLTPYIVR